MKQTIDICIFAPTFNRRHTLERAFESLMAQSCKDFEWLIIDDGSTDGTRDLVELFKRQADFPIRYFWKENGGRHTAVNYSYSILRSKYVVTLDSDDELLPTGIETLLNIWKSIPESDYERFWCVSARDVDSSTGEIVGDLYPVGVNQLSGKNQRKIYLKCCGEKHCCRKVSVLKQYPFPVYNDVKFVSEDMVWEQINRQYDVFCVNDAVGIYHRDSPDSLSTGSHHYKTFYYASLFYVNEIYDEFFFNRTVRRYTVNLSRVAILTRTSYSEVMRSINAFYKKVLVTLGYPISLAWVAMHPDRMKYSTER